METLIPTVRPAGDYSTEKIKMLKAFAKKLLVNETITRCHKDVGPNVKDHGESLLLKAIAGDHTWFLELLDETFSL